MIFLIVYDTDTSKLLRINEYSSNLRAKAMEDLRSEQERLLSELSHVEVALFEAESLSMLKRTHSRYFKSLVDLGKLLTDATRKNARQSSLGVDP